MPANRIRIPRAADNHLVPSRPRDDHSSLTMSFMVHRVVNLLTMMYTEEDELTVCDFICRAPGDSKEIAGASGGAGGAAGAPPSGEDSGTSSVDNSSHQKQDTTLRQRGGFLTSGGDVEEGAGGRSSSGASGDSSATEFENNNMGGSADVGARTRTSEHGVDRSSGGVTATGGVFRSSSEDEGVTTSKRVEISKN